LRRAPIIPFVASLAGGGLFAPLSADEAAPSLTRRQAVQEALARNPAVEAARQQVEQARARVTQAKALPDPSFEATLDGESGFLKPGSSPSRQFGLGFTIPFPTKLKLGGAVARADLHSAEHALTQLEHEIGAQAVQAYDALLVAERHLANLRDARSIALDFVTKTDARYQAGTVAKLDVIKARVDLAQAENALIANERDLATARAALDRVLGRPPGSPVEATDRLEVPPPLPDLDTLVRSAAAARPEALGLAAEQDGARSATRLARQYWLPDVSLNLLRDTNLGEPTSYSTELSVSLPLFFWQHRKGEVAEAVHRERELEAARRDLLAQIDLEVRSAYAAADTSQRQAAYLRDELLPEAREAYRIASVSYGLGGASALDLLDAKRTLLDAEAADAEALGAANDARAELELAVGAPLPVGDPGGSDAR
jgi:outer membrane protein, heavy metal efflux system